MDVAIDDGIIVQVGPNLSTKNVFQVVDVTGLYVVPGIIDIHGHHFYGTESDAYLSNGSSALAPDGYTFRSGVTTVVDVGGSGWRNFKTFKKQTIETSQTRVLSFEYCWYGDERWSNRTKFTRYGCQTYGYGGPCIS